MVHANVVAGATGLKFLASITMPAVAGSVDEEGSAAIAACMLRQISDFPNCDAS
jgi:hypothetical protein